MPNATNLLYSHAAATRILSVEARQISKFSVQTKYCKMLVNQHPVLIHKYVFKNHFVEYRKEQSKSILIAQVNANTFRAVNPKKNTAYTLYALQDGVECECEDYKNQILFFKKGVCKHGYAVLNFLGFNSLAEYVEKHMWIDSVEESVYENAKEFINSLY